MPPRVKTSIPPAPPKKTEPAAIKTKAKTKKIQPKALKDKKKTSDKAKDKTSVNPKQKGVGQGKGGGRKPWIPDYAFIENQARLQLTDKQIAALCNVDHRTFCEKKNEFPELITALERGRATTISAAATKLLNIGLAGDRQALQFILERKGGFKQTNIIEQRKKLEDMTVDELHALLETTDSE